MVENKRNSSIKAMGFDFRDVIVDIKDYRYLDLKMGMVIGIDRLVGKKLSNRK